MTAAIALLAAALALVGFSAFALNRRNRFSKASTTGSTPVREAPGERSTPDSIPTGIQGNSQEDSITAGATGVPSPAGKPSTAGTAPPSEHLASIRYTTLASSSSSSADRQFQLTPGECIDLERFNALLGDAHVLKWVGQPVDDIRRLFFKQVILDDETTIDVETLKVPGFIPISDAVTVTAANGQSVPAHTHAADILKRDGLLICTFQWHKERYGVPLDTRQPMEKELFQEAFVKNEAHHAGAIVPARRQDASGNWMDSYGAHNEPGNYHAGLYGDDGFVAAAQRLVFADFVSREQARGYTDSIICWMGLLNPFIKFPNNYNGGDPTAVHDRATLKTLLKNGVLAALGDKRAVAFLNDPANMTYCAEYMYINLNSVLYPFNQAGLTAVLDGDAAKAEQILDIQARHNRREKTILTSASGGRDFENLLQRNPSNPEFDAGNIAMPVVPTDLPGLDQLMATHGYPVGPNSLPFPPFTISQILRRAFRVMLPRDQGHDQAKIAAAQSRMMKYVETLLAQQLGLDRSPKGDPKLKLLAEFSALVNQQLKREFDSYDEFDQVIDQLMAQADTMLVGYGDRTRFVPPCIYLELGQQDGDDNLPQGWGFQLETVGAFISQKAVSKPEERVPMEWRTIELQTPFMRGDDVKLMQGAMIRAGLELTADGIFGPASQGKVKEFQGMKGLEQTGVIDEQTREALLV
jgi:hypothetical protein